MQNCRSFQLVHNDQFRSLKLFNYLSKKFAHLSCEQLDISANFFVKLIAHFIFAKILRTQDDVLIAIHIQIRQNNKSHSVLFTLEAIRTLDLPLRRRLLYPAELPGLNLQHTIYCAFLDLY